MPNTFFHSATICGPLRKAVTVAFLLAVGGPASAAAQDNASDDADLTFTQKLQFSMHVGVARGISSFDRHGGVAEQGRESQYRVRTGAAWGTTLAYAHNRVWGARADVDALFPVLLAETSRKATVQGQSVAWLGGFSLTLTPQFLCHGACVTFSAGPGAGFYELGEHKEVAKLSFPVSRTQLAFAARAGVDVRPTGKYRHLALGISNYSVSFSPDKSAESMTMLNHLMVSVRWSPP